LLIKAFIQRKTHGYYTGDEENTLDEAPVAEKLAGKV